MSPHALITFLSSVEVALGAVTLALLIRSKEFRTYWPMLVVSMWQTAPFFLLLYLQHLGRSRITAQKAYFYYFQTFWIAYAFQAVCQIFLTYTIFDGAMRPLQGLHRLGKIVYFWAGAISVFIAFNAITSPASTEGSRLMQNFAGQFQRVSGTITVSLVIFVCAAIRPMGLSLRSRVFGSGLGLIILALTNTLQANYFYTPRTMNGPYARIAIGMDCICQLIWIYYFSVPEPKRKFLLLPTTSPFHHWNSVARLLGNEPGYVAIGGVPPESFASAEIHILKRASAKMNLIDESDKPAE